MVKKNVFSSEQKSCYMQKDHYEQHYEREWREDDMEWTKNMSLSISSYGLRP